jgi:hypothetical protein
VPSARLNCRVCRVSPTTVSGGTSEMVLATPGNVSEMSRRTRAIEPTAPVAGAARRSTSRSFTRAVTCALVCAVTGPTTMSPSSQPMAIAESPPATTGPTERRRFLRSPRTAANIVP